MPRPEAKFSKPATTPAEQIELWRSKGLVIDCEERVYHYLSFIGYYRLSGYAAFFTEGAEGIFRPGTTFQNILEKYIFDRKLRLCVMDAIEKVEVGVRAAISNELSVLFGSHWFEDPCHFLQNFNHDSFLENIALDTGHPEHPRSSKSSECKEHYYNRYNDPNLPPSWMVFECLSMGTISRLFKFLTKKNKKKIAALFGVDGKTLTSWLHCMTHSRNICAHHSRLWNRKFSIIPKSPDGQSVTSLILMGNKTFYAQAVIIQILKHVVADGSQWQQQIAQLFSDAPHVNPQDMGFPQNWATQPVWLP